MAELNIINKTAVPTLRRNNIVGICDYQGCVTPTRKEVLQLIIKELKVSEKQIALQKINPIFGEQSATVTVHVYEKEEDLKIFEEAKKMKRFEEKKKEESREKSAPQSKAPKTEEKPKEEVVKDGEKETKE